MYRFDEELTKEEQQLIELLKNKTKAEQDEILGKLERKMKNDTLRIDR